MIVSRAASRRRAVSLVAGVAAIVLAACAAPIGGSAQPLPGDLTATARTALSASSASSRSTSSAATRSTAATRSSATTSRSATTAASSSSAVDGDLVLGPTGWKGLTLDMNEADAAALGMFAAMPPAGDGCQAWDAVLAAPIESVVISPTFGVVAIQPRAEAGMTTPEGMKIGWTPQQVAAKYSDFSVDDVDSPNGSLVPVPDNPFAFYRLTFADGKLANFMLESILQDCYG